MTNAPSADRVVLRTPLPLVGKAIPAGPRETTRVNPGRGRRIAWAILGLIAVALGGFGYWFLFLSPLTVTIAPVQSNLREEVFGLGTIGARVQSNVGFKVTGVLSALMVDQGDRVHTGQVLAKLDARDIEAQVEVMKAGVAQARANIEKAKADVASAETTLMNDKVISARRDILVKQDSIAVELADNARAQVRVDEANLTSARSAVVLAEAVLHSAEAQLAFEQATLSYYALFAPYDGWVISRNHELGDMFAAFGSSSSSSQSVFTLVAADTIWAVGYVDERLAGRLSVGQPAEIVLRSDPSRRITGHVARIEIQSDPINEERLVDVAFDQIPENIHLAEQAYVYISTSVLPHAVLVQPSAVADFRGDKGTGGHGAVWTVERGRVERRSVTFGPELLDGRLPILEGLPADSAVVAAPVSGLRVDRAAHVAEVPTP